MIRLIDILASFFGLLLASPLLVVLSVLNWVDSRAVLFYQKRVGQHQRPFILIKFRTMRPETKSVATHLVDTDVITSFGRFMRQTKLDELPQLWNVLRGDMSLVGPRPCLFNQKELITARAALNVFDARPGITGLGQIRGIDMSTPELLAKTDAKMLKNLSIYCYFRYIGLTFLGRGSGDNLGKQNS